MLPIRLQTVLILLHLLSIVFGLGAALIADTILVRRAWGRIITREVHGLITSLSEYVAVGLAAIWITGLAIVVHDPSFLSSPKLLGKVVIVMVLTLNATLIHYLVMPHLARQIGRRLFEGTPPWQRLVLSFAGAVSVISWLTPMVLGCSRELAGFVTVGGIVTFHLAVVAATTSLLFTATILFEAPNASWFSLAPWNGRTTGLSMQPDPETILQTAACCRQSPQAGHHRLHRQTDLHHERHH